MKQLLILSGKGGTGKTTLASTFINLAKAKVFADCDIDAPNLHLVVRQRLEPKRRDYYGLPKAEINLDLCVRCNLCNQHCRFDAIQVGAEYKVDHYACEGCGVCEVLCPTDAITLKPAVAGELRLYADDKVFSTAELKMGSGTSGMLVTEVKKQMRAAAIETELAIIDGSPGIGCPVIASLSGVDMVLIVAEPSISGISDMERIIKTANKFQTPIAICINKFDTNLDNTTKIESFCRQHKLPFVGRIPFDQKAVRAINNGQSLANIDCSAALAIKKVFLNTTKLLFGGSKMKIAVASERDMVTEHFGHCENFNIFEVEDKQIVKAESVPNPGHRPGFLPNYLHELGVNVIISGGMGAGAIDIFNEHGIEVITGASGNAKTAADRYLQGQLKSTGSVCENHMHAGECGGH